MARIVLGLATSHTPMLLVDGADLPRYEENDRRLRLLGLDGASAGFDDLPVSDGVDVTADALLTRQAAAHLAMAGLSDALRAADLDALIVIGDDQTEMLPGDRSPELLVYNRESIRSSRPAHAPGRPQWALRASDRYYPADGPVDYPVAAELARFLTVRIGAAAFEGEPVPMGHAFAFVHSQIMGELAVPVVPVLLNALYPPNQPSPARCIEIGEAIAAAVEAYPKKEARVGVLASGGLSHFVVDEALDREVVRALKAGDFAALAALPEAKLNSGSAEIRNWICAAGALRSLTVDRMDYIPGYRTRAGTGVGLGFAIWR